MGGLPFNFMYLVVGVPGEDSAVNCQIIRESIKESGYCGNFSMISCPYGIQIYDEDSMHSGFCTGWLLGTDIELSPEEIGRIKKVKLESICLNPQKQ